MLYGFTVITAMIVLRLALPLAAMVVLSSALRKLLA